MEEEFVLPPAVVTVMVPEVAPTGTVAVIVVSLDTEKLLAAVPLKLMLVAPEKLVPVSVTVVPIRPLVGMKLVIVGAAITMKLDELLAVPPGVVTLIVPVVAPVGTTAVTEVALTTL